MFWFGVLIAFALIIALSWAAGAVIDRMNSGSGSRRDDVPLLPSPNDDDPPHH